MTIVEFLEARIAEDEARAREAIEDDNGSDEGFANQYDALTKPPSGIGHAKGGFGRAAARMITTYAVPARVLAECAAKRRALEALQGYEPSTEWYVYRDMGERGNNAAGAVRVMAAVYKDHPDYQAEWYV